ncbi:hypothetical protein HPP92_026726 [Vanilla planifolia]|uniref:Uncharacterized protein n=1 Tax=Vanilla planifolia TaxID=51239 RepID=A0A835PEV1_VANPL|nr:hypothetical protein HPP92_026726 [Vanilla planifolia]
MKTSLQSRATLHKEGRRMSKVEFRYFLRLQYGLSNGHEGSGPPWEKEERSGQKKKTEKLRLWRRLYLRLEAEGGFPMESVREELR